MKLFICWSGTTSRVVAQVLTESLAKFIQAVKPGISGGVQAGSRWSVGVAAVLEDSQFSILGVAPESFPALWLLFDAGALSKTLNKTVVVPVLFHITPGDVR